MAKKRKTNNGLFMALVLIAALAGIMGIVSLAMPFVTYSINSVTTTASGFDGIEKGTFLLSDAMQDKNTLGFPLTMVVIMGAILLVFSLLKLAAGAVKLLGFTNTFLFNIAYAAVGIVFLVFAITGFSIVSSQIGEIAKGDFNIILVKREAALGAGAVIMLVSGIIGGVCSALTLFTRKK